MKYLALLTALSELLNRILAALSRRERERKQAEYEQDIEHIQDDPVGYARSEYGSVRQSDAGAPKPDMPSDEAKRP